MGMARESTLGAVLVVLSLLGAMASGMRASILAEQPSLGVASHNPESMDAPGRAGT